MASVSSDSSVIKEVYASIIGETTATYFRERNTYFGKIVRMVFQMVFRDEAALPMPPLTHKISLSIDASLTNNLSDMIVRALSSSNFNASKAMESIYFDIYKISEEIVQHYIGDLIASNKEYDRRMISTNIMLNTIDHIARALNDAVLQFYETSYVQDERFPSGYDNSAFSFISNFTDDMFQEYIEHHHNPHIMANLDIENEKDLTDEET